MCFTVLAAFIAFGPVSGGHVNTAISAGVVTGYAYHPQRAYKFGMFLMIFAAHIVGFTLGGLIVWALSHTDEENHLFYPPIAVLCPNNPGEWGTF